jgi:hypothetical protein
MRRQRSPMHPALVWLQAFVGYRDYGIEAGDLQLVVHDFVDHSQMHQLKHLLAGVRACGGGNAEDVAGGLQVWRWLPPSHKHATMCHNAVL